MAEIATGYAASNAGGTGAGAVIFSPTMDTTTLLLHEQGELDKGEDWRIEQQQKQLENTNKFLGALNPDLNGVLPADMDRIVQKVNAAQQKRVNYLQQGANPFSSSGGQAYLESQRDQNDIMATIAISKQANKNITEAITAQNADKGDKLDIEAGNKNIAIAFATPSDSRNADKFTNLTVPRQPNADATIEKFVNTFPEQKSDKISNQGGIISDTETSSKPGVGNPTSDPVQWNRSVASLAWGDDSKHSLQAEWSNLPLTTKQSYLQKVMPDGSLKTTAPDEAYQAWVGDKLLAHLVTNTKDTIHGESESAKVAAKKAGSSDDQIGFVQELASVMTRDPRVVTSSIYTPPTRDDSVVKDDKAQHIQMYGTTMLNSAVDLGTFSVIKKSASKTATGEASNEKEMQEIPNHITFAGYLPNTDILQVATVQSEYNYKMGLSKSPFVNTGYDKNQFKQLVIELGNKIPKSSKEEGLDPLTGAMMYAGKLNYDPYKINPIDDNAKAQIEQIKGQKAGYQPIAGTGTTKTYMTTDGKKVDLTGATPEMIDAAIKAGKIKEQ